MQTIYRFSGGDLTELRHDYGDLVKREFYDGELETEARADLSLTAQKAMSYPISLLRMTSNSSISYRRNWQHIRANKSGVRVIWFVRRGTCQLVRSRGSITVKAGECAIIDSSVPFHARMQPDDEQFEVVYAIVPAHLFVSHLAVAADLEEPLALDYANRESVVRLLDLLCDLGENIGARTAEPLAAAFLEALSERVREVSDCLSPRERNSNLRLADIKAHILRNLTNPDLNYEDVAAQCGISSRYLYYLLKADNTTFARLVWSQRLEKAREWLSSQELTNYAIREIAFMAGFKDAAHFSRIFKTTFGASPKEYRTEALKKAQGTAVDKALN
jgi:AraC-like DNA-binding protein/mannose-6-phosphate isomerase-like protein (cupin superfamily)